MLRPIHYESCKIRPQPSTQASAPFSEAVYASRDLIPVHVRPEPFLAPALARSRLEDPRLPMASRPGPQEPPRLRGPKAVRKRSPTTPGVAIVVLNRPLGRV